MDQEMKAKGNFPACSQFEGPARLSLLKRLLKSANETIELGCDLVNYLELTE